MSLEPGITSCHCMWCNSNCARKQNPRLLSKQERLLTKSNTAMFRNDTVEHLFFKSKTKQCRFNCVTVRKM